MREKAINMFAITESSPKHLSNSADISVQVVRHCNFNFEFPVPGIRASVNQPWWLDEDGKSTVKVVVFCFSCPSDLSCIRFNKQTRSNAGNFAAQRGFEDSTNFSREVACWSLTRTTFVKSIPLWKLYPKKTGIGNFYQRSSLSSTSLSIALHIKLFKFRKKFDASL